jgi:hypothetical protein
MKPQLIVLLGLLLTCGGSAPAKPRPHPRIWLTPALLSDLRSRAAASDRHWLRVKAQADALLTCRMPGFTVTAAANTNPVRFTIAEAVPWSGETPVFIGGATGAWAAVNASGDRPSPVSATRVGPHTFTLPIDARRFGRFTGQRVVLFFSEGGYSGYGYNGLEWQSRLETLGIAYQVTGDAAYASKAVELVDYIASLGAAGMLAPVAIDSGFPSRSTVYSLAIAYDWLHDRLTAHQRGVVIKALNLWFDWFTRAAYERTGPAYGNYFGGHVLGFGLAGLATEAENPRGGEMAAHVRGLFSTHVAPAFASGGFAGGYPVEGFAYGSNHFQRLLVYMLAVETATGADAGPRREYARKIARNLLYNLKPNDWQVSDEGAWAGDYTGVLQPSLPIVLSSLLAGTDEGKWMQHLHQNLAVAPHGGQNVDPFVAFLFADRARPAADYRLSQPSWFASPGDHHFYRRSSWQPDAVWTSVAAGAANWAGHQMRGAGHLAIQRGNDYLLVNSGQWKGATGDHGMPQAFDLRSWRSNTLFVDDRGDYLFTGDDYAGGQGYWGTGGILAHDGTPEFGYVRTDLTSAYSIGDRKPLDRRSVRHFHRSVLSMGSGVVVVFDRMQFLKADYVKKLYFHLNPAGGPPAISGDSASIRVGRSALFIRTLAPAPAVLAAAIDPVSAADRRAITYRLEVSDAVAAPTFKALHVLIATGASAAAIPPTMSLQAAGGTMVGAMIKDDATWRVGLFSADGGPQTAVSYDAIHASGQKAVHVLVDLTPGARYSVTRDGVSIGDVAASSQGVLTFRTSQGGHFTVTGRSAASRAPGRTGR